MKKKNMTIEDLAGMVQRGFGDINEKIATKQELKSLELKIDKRFDRIEKLILADHRERIEKLEVEIKEIKDLLAFK
ncbi:MAG: hypothetical protein A3D35_01505 [Candidatus Staskawiczbacteria bacterium RIFCSPHIGHO2_02_FULL_34_9]|uniref:Uncharacterized protein n=1 Tax=Candidatus Staskawiczbacteria bacterium RIFCSPHIGHO2_02_FULL_34_9 TaxID=1802206 RepID=A0A1G2HYS1_9BACT|nr:MAG: hypothetical protein A3D35_01505 [Candidatus Staskawiczbacteria bacterium RIFCSPHIGHO2_02_FULL_34_9]